VWTHCSRAGPRTVKVAFIALFSTAQLTLLSTLTAQPPPFTSGVDRLAAEATIYRDVYGVPHIFAGNEEALYFAFGYAQAEDHLEAMMVNYRTAGGRMAEAFGEQYLLSDGRSRTFRFRRMAIEGYADVDPRVRLMVESFATGVNYYIATHRAAVPDWASRMAPADVIALAKYFIHMHYQFDFQNVADEMLRGSNACAVGPGRSDSGDAMLLADPHLPWSGVTRLYEAHLRCPGLNVSGATLFGLPVILVGHNERIAWAITGNRPEVTDVFAERLSPDRPGYYFDGANWVPLDLIEDSIVVSGPAGPREEKRVFSYTRHGPVVSVVGNVAYAVSLSGWRDVNCLRGWYLVNRATGLEEFKAALALQHIPVLNFLYADVEGNIYYVYNGRIPVKSDHYLPGSALPGWVRETNWTGLLTFEQLPQTENPLSGFLLNCNNPPWFSTRNCDILPARFPKYISNDHVTFRAQRMMELLADDSSVTVDEMKKIPWDSYLLVAEQAKPLIAAAVEQLKTGAPARAAGVKHAAELIGKWDNKCNVANRGAALFHAWFSAYRRLFPGASARDLVSGMGMAGVVETDAAVRALEEAVSFLLKEYGELEVRWGDVHKMRRGRAERELAGADITDPLNLAVEGEFVRGVSYAVGGHAFVMVARMGDPVEAFTIVPFGSSEDPRSSHYADQMLLFTASRLKQAWFTEEDVLSNLESAWGSDISLPFPDEESSARVRTVRPVAVTGSVSEARFGVPPPRELKALSKCFSVNGPPASEPRIEFTLGIRPAEQAGRIDMTEPPALYYCPTAAGKWQKCESTFDPRSRRVTGTGTQFGTYVVLGRLVLQEQETRAGANQ